MPSGANTRTRVGRRAIRLRNEPYVTVMNLLGHTSDASRARASELGAEAVRRARSGENVGEVFVAQTLATLAPHRDKLSRYGLGVCFEDLFDLVRAS